MREFWEGETEVFEDSGGGFVAAADGALEEFVEDAGEAIAHGFWQVLPPDPGILHRGIQVKRMHARQQVNASDTQAVEVAGKFCPPHHLLWRGVTCTADHRACLRQRSLRGIFRRAKIHQHQRPVALPLNDVFGL
ncbi:MAG: hypothetical protein OHK0037_21090 [Elainellaceae cyanobacterium]